MSSEASNSLILIPINPARRSGIPHLWAYMLLGQRVPASNLFYLVILLHAPLAHNSFPPSSSPRAHDIRLVVDDVIPLNDFRYFLPNLIMHALLSAPLDKNNITPVAFKVGIHQTSLCSSSVGALDRACPHQEKKQEEGWSRTTWNKRLCLQLSRRSAVTCSRGV